MASDYYTTLGVPYNATPDEIRSAYFQLARSFHPDANHDPSSSEMFLSIQQSYEILSNPQKRAAYDGSLPAEIRSGPKISVGVKYSRSVIPILDEPQLLYVLVDLVCMADGNRDHLPPNHVCLVIDRSTSMAGSRLDMVKASALNLLQQLRAQDTLSVVAFSDRAEVLIPPTRASTLTKSDHRISLLQTGGGTEILQGLTLGMQQLRQTDNRCHRHLIMLTDGHTYGDEEGCLDLAEQAAGEGISISVLGIGHEWNDSLMDEIASISGGNAMFVGGARELDHFLMQKLADLESIYARGLRFDFESSPDVTLRYAFRISPNIGPLPKTGPILLGDIQHRKSISFLLEFVIPPLFTDQDRLTMARGKIWMDIPGRTISKSRLFLDLFRPMGTEIEAETPPQVIIDAMARLTLYRLQDKVREEVEGGQIENATRHLHYLATHLLSQGDRELAHTVLVEAEHIQQSRRFSSEGEKRIKYGTRALLLPAGLEFIK